MKSQELETYLLASRPAVRSYGPFTRSVLQEIRRGQHGLEYEKTSAWQGIREYVRSTALRRAVALSLLVAVISFVGLSGYAFAKGTDPFSLIKRWVSGEQVKVTYQDPQTGKQREFAHGAKRSYSDLAISAFAEISLIDLLHFHATNAYTVPKDGVEHISDPFRIDFISPRLGTVEQVNDKEVVLHLTYSMGRSKVEASQDIDQRIVVPRGDFYYYDQGKLTAVPATATGKLVEVFQDKYLRHKQHSGERPQQTDLYSVFVMSYPEAAIKEATQNPGPVAAYTEEELQELLANQSLYETNTGAFAQVCLNNGADQCPHAFDDNMSRQNFFDARITPGDYGGPSRQNPDTIPYGEAVLYPTAETRQYLSRAFEGKITKIAGDRITVKTASGQLWTFQYSEVNQKTFARLYGALKTGDLLSGGVLASVYDWDRRDFDNKYVAGMSRL